MPAKTFPLAAALFITFSGGLRPPLASADDDPKQLAAQAQAVLKTHCYRCHGQDGAIEGGMNYVTDLAKLVARRKIVPGDPAASRLFKRMDDDSMPPSGEKPRPTAEELAT